MLLRISDVRKSYGVHEILRSATLQVNEGEQIGLVGRNGSGKTTLLRLISGRETPDDGDVARARGIKLGLLEQHITFKEQSTVHESALAAFGELQQIEHEMHLLEEKMATAGEDLERILARYSELQHRFEHEGGFEYSAKAEAILLGLGFDRDKWLLDTKKLSGGQKNRLAMARLLLAEPDLLLLDEPTNHLDLVAVEWFEEFLSTYKSAYINVSHDRYFLDRTCHRIIEIEQGRAVSYAGNYSKYLIEREGRREAQHRAYENQQRLINKTEEFIRKNLAGQKTKQAKSRRTMLERMERIKAVSSDQPSGDFRLKNVARAGGQILIVKDAVVGFPSKVLVSNATFTLTRGECLGVIGPNGSGKTTLIKSLLGKLPLISGEVRWGSNVKHGYYAQELDDLDGRNEIIMELRRVAPSSATAGELRSFLAKFLFRGDDVYKQVRDLSGGEKGRLALAKLIYSEVNVLVMDEPTNHLDIASREALEEALEAYSGTIITISHDRFFLDRIATQILALDGCGGAEHYDGDYTAYHDSKTAPEINIKNESSSKIVGTPNVPAGKSANKSAERSARTVRRKSSEKRIERDPQTIEAEIAQLEEELVAISEEMAKSSVLRDRVLYKRIHQEYEEKSKLLHELYTEWTVGMSQPQTPEI